MKEEPSFPGAISVEPNLLIAGNFNGIFRSDDAGVTWQQLPTASPVVGARRISGNRSAGFRCDHAGTWYLPYKTMDGGRTWPVLKCIIDDSDIFAIDIDPRDTINHCLGVSAGFMKRATPATTGRKYRAFLPIGRTRAIMQHRRCRLVFAARLKGFGVPTKGAIPIRGWYHLAPTGNKFDAYIRRTDTVYLARTTME